MKRLLLLLIITVSGCAKNNPGTVLNNFSLDESGKAFIIEREGYRDYAYHDGKVWAIGFGNTFYENGVPVQKGDRINTERAYKLFDVVVKQFEECVNREVKSPINQSQFNALISYAYNRGCGSFRKSQLLKVVNNNPNDPLIKELFAIEWGSNMAYKNGLIKRRKLEAEIYFSHTTQKRIYFDPWMLLIIVIALLLVFRVQILEYLLQWKIRIERRKA